MLDHRIPSIPNLFTVQLFRRHVEHENISLHAARQQFEAADCEPGVLQCNAEFYRAFREGDVAAMDRVWTTRQRGGVDMVTCVHPGREAMSGRAAILESWKVIMAAGSPDIRPEAVKVRFRRFTSASASIRFTFASVSQRYQTASVVTRGRPLFHPLFSLPFSHPFIPHPFPRG
jgi:hypothetical protein